MAAVEDDKGEGKEGEEEGVFLRFGDDLAVDGDRQRASKSGQTTSNGSEVSRIKVADGFVEDAGSNPRRSLPASVKQVGRLNANAPTIPTTSTSTSTHRIRILVHPKAGNGSGAAAGDGDGGRIGGAGGKTLQPLSAGDALLHRFDVLGVSAGKQGRQGQQLVVGAVGVIEVAVVAFNGHRVSSVPVAAASDAGGASISSGAAAGEDPDGLVGVILAGVNIDEHLGLVLFQQRPRKQSCRQKKGYPPPPPIGCCDVVFS